MDAESVVKRLRSPFDLEDARYVAYVLVLAALLIFAAAVVGFAVRVGFWAFGGMW